MYLNVPFLLTQGECVENTVENNVESLLRIRWVFHVVTSTTNIEFTHTYMNVHLVFILFICINIVVRNITTGCCIMYRGVHRVVCYRVTPCRKHKYKYCGIHIATDFSVPVPSKGSYPPFISFCVTKITKKCWKHEISPPHSLRAIESRLENLRFSWSKFGNFWIFRSVGFELRGW